MDRVGPLKIDNINQQADYFVPARGLEYHDVDPLGNYIVAQ